MKMEKKKMAFIQTMDNADIDIDKKTDVNSRAFSEFKEKFSQMKTDMERLDESKEKFNDVIERFNDKEFLEEKYNEFSDEFEKQEVMKQQIRRLEKKYDSTYRNDIFELFNDVFDNIRSKNHGIVKIPGKNWEVTCGKKGFARRDNVQAQDLRESDMWTILEHADLVAKNLRFNNMEEQADKLLLFADNVPDVKYRGYSYSATPVFALDNPISSTTEHGWGAVKPITFENIQIRNDEIVLYSNYEYEKENDDGEMETITDGAETETMRMRNHRRFGVEQAIAWMQLKPHVEKYFEMTAEHCKQEADAIVEQKDNLKQEFAKYILMKQL